MRHWLITDRGDDDVRKLIDGESVNKPPHYSRQSPGARQFCRNGQSLVFVTADLRAAWISFRPTPGKATRPDKRDVWECALFRNEGPHLSSELIREAEALTWALWGWQPSEGLITFIRPDKVLSRNPGYCYKRAGWVRAGAARDGKPMLRAPGLSEVPDWTDWGFRGERGGKLRRELLGEDTAALTKWTRQLVMDLDGRAA